MAGSKTRKNRSKTNQTRKAKSASQVKPSPTLVKAVNKTLARRTETKFAVGPPTNFNTSGNIQFFTAFTSGITSTNEVYNLIPAVTQGSDDHQRDGNVIQPISLLTKVNLALFTSSSMSIYCDVYFCTSKNVKDYELTGQIPTGELLNKGDGTNVAYDGTSYTAMYPINKAEFTVIAHKRYLLQKGANDPNVALSTGSPSSTDTFRHFASFSQKIPLPNKLLYENNTKRYPTNAFPFMMVGFVGSDANGNNAPASARVQVQAQSHLHYKDF
ncbi:capsid protein [Chicken proventriculitis-associated circular virus 8]|nr:capsid protein [Chicken proventriculitis-associated circular virus 8]